MMLSNNKLNSFELGAVHVVQRNLKLSILFLSINIGAMVSGCVDAFIYSDGRLKVLNKSTADISVFYSNGNNEIGNSIDYYLRYDNVIKPDSIYTLQKRGKKDEWNAYIATSPERKISIYIFAVDTLKAYDGLETMRSLCYHHKYLKKFTYTKSQLDKDNWKIVFSK